MSRVGAETRAPVSRLPTPVVRLSSNFAGSRRARASRASAGLERIRHENPSCLSFESSTSSRKTRDRSFPTTVLFKSSLSRFAAHPCRLTRPGPAVQRGGPDSSRYLAPLQRPFDPRSVSSKMRLLSNRDNRRSLTSTSGSIDSHAACRARRLGCSRGRRHLTMHAELRWLRSRLPRRSGESGCRSVLGGLLDRIRLEPSGRLLPVRGVVDHGRKARTTSDALAARPTGRNPEERAERRATPAPSRATAAVDAPSAFHRGVERSAACATARSRCLLETLPPRSGLRRSFTALPKKRG